MKKVLFVLFAAILISFIPEPEKKINIQLTLQQWETVLQGLNELPMKYSAPISQEIIKQAQQQLTDSIKNKK